MTWDLAYRRRLTANRSTEELLAGGFSPLGAAERMTAGSLPARVAAPQGARETGVPTQGPFEREPGRHP